MNTLNQMTEIKNNLSKLSVKKMQYQGALENFKARIATISTQVKDQFNVEIAELQTVMETTKKEYEKSEAKIIKDFTKLAESQESIASLLSSQAPFTIDSIQAEVNKLLPLKSNKEGQLSTLKSYQAQIETDFKNEFGIAIKESDAFIQNMSAELATLQGDIVTKYNEILEDEEIRKLVMENN